MKKNVIPVVIIAILLLLLCGCDNLDLDEEQDSLVDNPVPLSEDPVQDIDEQNIQALEDEQNEETSMNVEVIRVVDGDTIEVEFDGNIEKIRMIGIDTPESVHPNSNLNVPYGQIASDFTKEKLQGKIVELEFDVQERDRYGRLLAYVYLDGEMFNKTLLDEGNALISTFPPNVKYVDLFTESQNIARENSKGMWGYTGEEAAESDSSADLPADGKYIGSVKSKKIHFASCTWGQKISENNAEYFDDRDDAIDAGYVPCKVCNP